MARIRSIKPEFFTSETLKLVDKVTRLTFIGLWTYVDDNGVGVDNVRLITAALYPLEEDFVAELQQVEDDLWSLANRGVIKRYAIDGRQYLFITSWDEHQKISHPAKARYFRPMPGAGNPPGPHPVVSAMLLERHRRASGKPPETLSGPENTSDSGGWLDAPSNSASEDPDPDEFEEYAGQAPLPKPSGEPQEPLPQPSALSREQGAGNKEQGSLTSEPAAPDPDTTIGDRPDVERICTHLADRIAANGSKRPNIGKAWLDAARLMLDRDGPDGRGIPETDAHAAIDWCQNHAFWRANILSMPKLREKYDQLRLAAAAERQRGTGPAANGAPRMATGDLRVAQAADLAAYFREQDGPGPAPVNVTEILQLLPGIHREP